MSVGTKMGTVGVILAWCARRVDNNANVCAACHLAQWSFWKGYTALDFEKL
jgi:hypothetical protein